MKSFEWSQVTLIRVSQLIYEVNRYFVSIVTPRDQPGKARVKVKNRTLNFEGCGTRLNPPKSSDRHYDLDVNYSSPCAGSVFCGLLWLRNGSIAFPSLILELDVLDGHSVRVSIQIWQRLILRYPAPVHLVRKNLLPRLIEYINDNVFAEIRQRTFRTCAGLPHTVSPFFERGVMSYASFQGNGVKHRPAWRFSICTWIAAFPVLNHFRRAPQSTDFGYSRHILAVPLD